jgi:uncharacterized membrane protein (DUF441 family)
MKIGFWSAVFLLLSGIGYAACFIAMIVFYPGTAWNGVESFAADYRTGWGTVLLFMQLIALVQPIAFATLAASVCDLAPADKKIWARAGLLFAVAFMAVSGVNYFVQMTVVRQSVLAGQLEGMAPLIQLNPASPMFALVILSWGLFQGLASLAIAPIFDSGKLENALRWLLVVYGLNGLMGTAGCLMGNPGILVAFLAITNIVQPFLVVAFALLFHRLDKKPP